MKPAEKIKRLIRDRRYKASSEDYDKRLGSFLQAVDDHLKHKAVPSEPKLWRTIMTSRMTKIATAAVIIIAAYLILHQSSGSVDVTTVTFAQITENMKQMPWMHIVAEVKQAAGTEMVDIRYEGWFCVERKMAVVKESTGKVIFQDDLEHIFQEYDPTADKITISHDKGLDWSKDLGSVVDVPGAIIKIFEEAGDKVVRETGKYKGKDALIFKMRAVLGGVDTKFEMTVDAEMYVALCFHQQAFDKAGKLTQETNAYFDYPETGPESIYDVGVPVSTKIVREEKE
ncbi:hypothetical protein ACFL5Z_09775 [Planctomycetota bacterium]